MAQNNPATVVRSGIVTAGNNLGIIMQHHYVLHYYPHQTVVLLDTGRHVLKELDEAVASKKQVVITGTIDHTVEGVPCIMVKRCEPLVEAIEQAA